MELAADKLVLFGAPGCSNCLRAKEFLTDRDVDFVYVDVENTAGARDKLLEFGVRYTPTLVKGTEYVFGNNLQAVAQFAGVPGPDHTLLPPEELVKKWITILRAAQRYVRQLSDEQMNTNVMTNRPRSIRILEHHIFNVVEGLIGCSVHGANNVKALTGKRPEEGKLTTTAEMDAYAEDVIARIERWWNTLDDKTCQRKLDTTDYGIISVQRLLDRSTWHSAQHTRQLADVLEQRGIVPDGKLTEEDLAGLLLPERIWE